MLRSKSRKRLHSDDAEAVAVIPSTSQGHVNFFEELEDGTVNAHLNRDYLIVIRLLVVYPSFVVF